MIDISLTDEELSELLEHFDREVLAATRAGNGLRAYQMGCLASKFRDPRWWNLRHEMAGARVLANQQARQWREWQDRVDEASAKRERRDG